jgi:ribonuclease P protein component
VIRDANAFRLSTTKKTPGLSKLKNSVEFQSVYKGGARKDSRSFVVFVLANGLDHSRVGLTTPRKLGRAVQRNQIRRRIREILRSAWPSVPRGVDIVVNPRRSASEREFAELKTELLSLLGVSV